MPVNEYSTPGGGGKLKLKGSKVADGRVEKKKKKKQQKESKKASSDRDTEQQQQQEQPDETTTRESSRVPPEEAERQDESSPGVESAGKTEAERKHEEMRKKRLQERLKREGVKTHKERVEELNKYLSRLSEHHDMPKIGPG
ncbi:DUF1754 domain-containing protein [Aspergillus homomorphus CBS 101889]|uniref:DUF1754-domain-containing protein n=1 Tax=Aspergillus homomorphus (strain CBS 101889) TaxID=1450537 RepID=A0A395IA38_ASPHC|nr:DUF1754-domain-containing protein [Aspergillus homomorphus CBS 101889]RAL17120.1 DUF1754-domain-containing protein [Aspergillus homomorphus CBS 101889]